MRGYANEAMGKVKVAVALAAQSPELVVAGIAQQTIGEMQKFVGEAKLAADPDELKIVPEARRS
ncbi:MAG: CsbD family protein [Methylocystis sp.]|nr:CsbD family protein [Methylocystis sp.]